MDLNVMTRLWDHRHVRILSLLYMCFVLQLQMSSAGKQYIVGNRGQPVSCTISIDPPFNELLTLQAILKYQNDGQEERFTISKQFSLIGEKSLDAFEGLSLEIVVHSTDSLIATLKVNDPESELENYVYNLAIILTYVHQGDEYNPVERCQFDLQTTTTTANHESVAISSDRQKASSSSDPHVTATIANHQSDLTGLEDMTSPLSGHAWDAERTIFTSIVTRFPPPDNTKPSNDQKQLEDEAPKPTSSVKTRSKSYVLDRGDGSPYLRPTEQYKDLHTNESNASTTSIIIICTLVLMVIILICIVVVLATKFRQIKNKKALKTSRGSIPQYHNVENGSTATTGDGDLNACTLEMT
ncbi:uncharacterized protein LOC144440106 [Glandiceps talaboti]